MLNSRKEDYLKRKISPFDVNIIKKIDDVLKSLKLCGFQGRNLGIAADILYEMFNDKSCLTILTLSGAMVPAGMGHLICELIENNLIDVIISTGANITHDFIDAFLNGGHYQGGDDVDDEDLFKHRINRIYDVFLPEDNYEIAEKQLLKILLKKFSNKTFEITPSEFCKIIGNEIFQYLCQNLTMRGNRAMRSLIGLHPTSCRRTNQYYFGHQFF